MSILSNPFKRRKKLHFALVVSDRKTDGFKFESDKDCKMFVTTGEVLPDEVIPRSVLKNIVEKFTAPEIEGSVRISEKTQ